MYSELYSIRRIDFTLHPDKAKAILVVQHTSSLTDVAQESLQGDEFLGVLFSFLLRMSERSDENDVHRDHFDDCRKHTILKRQERLHLLVQ